MSKWVSEWVTIVKNTTREHSQRLLNLETFDQSDEDTWPDQQKNNDKDNDKDNDSDNDNDKDNDKDI